MLFSLITIYLALSPSTHRASSMPANTQPRRSIPKVDSVMCWYGVERRSGTDRRQLKDRRLNHTQRQIWHEARYGMKPRDALTIPPGQWERRSGQDRRGHPFYTSHGCSNRETNAGESDDMAAPVSDG